MSQAFMRESDDQSLEDIAPSLKALIMFLTKENNGIPVREINTFKDEKGRTGHFMSNGLSYATNDAGRWVILEA